MMGMGKQFDELVLSMNRAAEAAVPEAKALLVDAVKKMSVEDAKKILTGGDTAGTEYFKQHTEAPLSKKFLPIVKQATDRVGLAQQYNSLASQAKPFGLVKDDQATVEQYVTKKALDGLYLMIAEEEKAIRKDPVGQSSALLKKVFGALQ
jgi:enolase